MLDTDTRRRIDTARDILVGKVPDPKSQVEQITIALIYKFMDDMDAESEELGGVRTFFAGEFERYGWAKLMAPGIGGHEMLNLYAEAITRMPENPGIPALFRDIFKNAFLPYRDPETLKAFLKVIDDFSYDHSERLGDAFEYLLSVLGSQGDAGQFRTPRHIIDFMVALVDPRKDERILDPACGTAGFLISAFKHILAANERDGRPGAALSPDERTRLMGNIHGYDISPDMVRLSLVNLYLHGFNDPHVDEYDTLTSDDHWNDYYNVILANPPFMSPKGGIRPHKRFSVSSNRSEVLFVDYIAEHLLPGGRAAVIVPEGVIFQSGKAYKALRKLLVEEYLVGVISLPAGVFNPYSGVKTSILWLDKTIAKQTDSVLFVKIEADGFDLGAQRREIKRNDLPEALAGMQAYKEAAANLQPFDTDGYSQCELVTRQAIAENNDYNLSGERYRPLQQANSDYHFVSLGNKELFRVESGGTPRSTDEECWNGDIKWITLVDLPATNFVTEIFDSERKITDKGLQTSSARLIPPNSIVVSSRATIGRIGINRVPLATNQGFKNVVIEDPKRVSTEYVAFILTGLVDEMDRLASGGTFKEISKTNFESLQIPLPPLAEQEAIVAEVESYQRIIDGARQVVENWRPRIDVDPAWPVVKLGEVDAQLKSGFAFGKGDKNTVGVPHIRPMNVTTEGEFTLEGSKFIPEEDFEPFTDYNLQSGDVLFNNTNSKELVGKTAFVSQDIRAGFSNHMTRIRVTDDRVNPMFLALQLHQLWREGYFLERCHKWVGQAGINTGELAATNISLPDRAIQDRLVADIECERALIQSNQTLITRFEQKIKDRIARVWGN